MEIPSTFPLVAPSKLCLTALNRLLSSLEAAGDEHRSLMPLQTLRNQRDRFKIWASNLGALQEGRASLDFRLRESILMQSAVHKLLKQLEKTVTSSIEVVCGVRKPLEESLASADGEEDSWGDSGDESSSDEQDGINTRTELGQNTIAIMQILSDLFKLSFKIRNPATRSSGQSVVKPLLFKQTVHVDDTTTVDLLACFATYDRSHIEEAFRELRRAVHGRPKLKDVYPAYDYLTDSNADESSPPPAASVRPVVEPQEEIQAFLIDRWSKSVTNRRRFFAYWESHARKLAKEDKERAQAQADSEMRDRTEAQPAPMPMPAAALAATALIPAAVTPSLAGKSILSGTEGTTYDRRLDVEIDTQSVVSYTSTTYDVDGTVVDLPRPPPLKPPHTEFQCPYCWVTCSARHARGKSWREHILHDLQPYMCTYEECPDADAMYASRSAWLAHEADVHRRVWRCFAHSEPLFKSQGALQQHLEAEHGAVLGPVQIQEIAKLSHASAVDQRSACPFCQSTGPFKKGLANHMAFHMEQLACFAVPRGSGDDDDASSRGSNTNSAHGKLSADSLASVPLVFSDASSGHGDGSNPQGGEARSVAFSPDGKLLASALDMTVRLWDMKLGYNIRALEDHSDCVTSVAFSPSGRIFASASVDRTIKLWDAATVQCFKTLEGHSSSVTSVAFSPDGKHLASASDDSTVRLWDVTLCSQLYRLEGHSDCATSAAFSPSGSTLASASVDSTIKLWDTAAGICLLTLEGHSSWVRSVAFSPDALMLASASDDKTIRFWDTATGQHQMTLEGHSSSVRSVSFSPDAKTLASASDDKTIRLWDAATGRCRISLEGHGSSVRSLAFSPDGKRLASASDITVRFWDAATGQYFRMFRGDSRNDGPMRTWNVATVRQLLNDGGDLDSKDEEGQTPLIWAAKNGHESLVLMMLNEGANLGLKDESGRTPLVWAVKNRHEDVAHLLLDKGADITFENVDILVPLS